MEKISSFMIHKEGESIIGFPSLSKVSTDANIQNVKEVLGKLLHVDVDSRKWFKEHILKKKQESIDIEGESDEFLQETDFIHQILSECDIISRSIDLFSHEPKLEYKLPKEKSTVSRLNITKAARDEMYMLSVIACDLISLEESHNNLLYKTKAASGYRDHMQDILQVPDATAKALMNKAHRSSDYRFNIKLVIHRVTGLKGQIDDVNHPTMIYCRIGCLSKAMVEQKKINLNSKGTHVYTTDFVTDTINPVWNEEFQIPLGFKEDYLLIEVWRSKILQGKKKSNNIVSSCLLKVDLTIGTTVEEEHELKTTKGNGKAGTVVVMSLKIIANTSDLQFISQYDASQKLAIFQKFISEITHYLYKSGANLCFGRLTEPFQCIQCKLIEVLKLSEFQVRATAFECPEVWGESKIMNIEDFENSLELLNTEWDKVDNTIITSSQKIDITTNIMAVFNIEIKRLSNILTEFPPNELESKSCVETIIFSILGSYHFLLDRGEIHRQYNMKDEITKVITEGISNWYRQKKHSILDKSSPRSHLETLIKLCDSILYLMEGSDMNYREAFSAVKIDYIFVLIATIDREIAEESNQACNVILGEDAKDMRKLYFQMFHLYRKLFLILKRISGSNQNEKKLEGLQLINLEDWFRPFLNHWCVILHDVCMQSIQTMINIEEGGTHEYQGCKVSSSAIDIGLCLLPSYLMFTKVEEWTNWEECVQMALQIIQMNIEALRNYSNSMKDKIMTALENSQTDSFQINAELCIRLNNNHCTKHYVIDAKGKMNIKKLNPDDACQMTLVDELFKASLENIDAINLECINAIGKKFRTQFTMNYELFIGNSQGSHLINQNIDDLMNWLLQNVIAIVQHLSSDLFLPMLEELWVQTLACISEYKYMNESNQSTCQAIYLSLDYLRNFFHNEGQGITDEKVNGTIYYRLVEHFNLYRLESYELMLRFGCEVSELCKQAPDNIGSCTFNVVYVRDKQMLEIRIIQVQNIPKVGAQTIYLEANVLPKHELAFTESKTKTRKYEKSIIFDESIILPLPTESIDRGCVLQLNIFYKRMILHYGGSVYLTSKEIGQMSGPESLRDLLKGENEVRTNTKRSFLANLGESEILTILRDRKSEGANNSKFVDSVTQVVKEEKIQMFSEGKEEATKFFNIFRKK